MTTSITANTFGGYQVKTVTKRTKKPSTFICRIPYFFTHYKEIFQLRSTTEFQADVTVAQQLKVSLLSKEATRN